MEILVRIYPIVFVLFFSVAAQVLYTLDRADEAFNDQYVGCKKAMDRSLASNNVLANERRRNKVFSRAWDEAELIWHQQKKNQITYELPEGFEDHHGIALVAYSGFISKSFNDELRTAGRSYDHYIENFHFKSLHYYLTTAVQLLSYHSCRKNQHLIHEDLHGATYWPSNESRIIRVGQFLTAFEDEPIYETNETFSLTSCFAVNIQEFSQFPDEKIVVVPGFEVFQVTYGKDHSNFSLSTTGKNCSNFNCAYLRGLVGGASISRNVFFLMAWWCLPAIHLIFIF
uniref:NAD(P)(+)--arginine ADP-ribosyltransferase n=1 Tax=Leptobrachium leishanense TaxID=445787 RepID=A0A8C5LR96_9ANUR